MEPVVLTQNSAGSTSAPFQTNWERVRSQMWNGGRLRGQDGCQDTFHLLRLLRLNLDNVSTKPRWGDTHSVCVLVFYSYSWVT